MNKKFKVGDIVYTDTHAVYQQTQESLSRKTGIVINNDDYPYNIHIAIFGVPKELNPVGFSEFELSHKPITNYKMITKKQIQKWNDDFKVLPKAEQRVAIAKDVLKQIGAKKYLPSQGAYIAFYSGLRELRDKQVQENFNIVECDCCALGACILSVVKFTDTFTFDELEGQNINIWRRLNKYFSKEQICLIEYTFEGWKEYEKNGIAVTDLDFEPSEIKLQHCRKFYYKYNDSTKRLQAIMRNIIKNKGTFIPQDI